MIHKHSHHNFLSSFLILIYKEINFIEGQFIGAIKDLVKFIWKFGWAIIYAFFYLSIIAVIGLILFSTLISAL